MQRLFYFQRMGITAVSLCVSEIAIEYGHKYEIALGSFRLEYRMIHWLGDGIDGECGVRAGVCI